MSQWTHVAACLRIDDIRYGGGNPPKLGNPVEYGDPEEKWEACTVPRGSEGSLHHQMWTCPDEGSLAAYTIMVWGDLRDYSNEDELLAYFKSITDGHIVRQAVVEIAVEGVPAHVFRYDSESGEFVRQADK